MRMRNMVSDFVVKLLASSFLASRAQFQMPFVLYHPPPLKEDRNKTCL